MFSGCILDIGGLLIMGWPRPFCVDLGSLRSPTLRGTALCLELVTKPLSKSFPGLGSQGQGESPGITALLTLRFQTLPAAWALLLIPTPQLMGPCSISGLQKGTHPSGSFIHVHQVVGYFPLGPVLVWSITPASISAPIKILHLSSVSLSLSEIWYSPFKTQNKHYLLMRFCLAIPGQV